MLFLRPDRYLFISCFFIFRAEIVDGDKSLVIKNVVPSDEGIYVCEAQNSVGQITSKAQLVVNCEYQRTLFVIFQLFRLLRSFVYCGVSSLNFKASPSIRHVSTIKAVQSSTILQFQHVIDS